MNIISIKPQPIPEQLGIYSQAGYNRYIASVKFLSISQFLGGSSNLSLSELRDVVLVRLILQVGAWSYRCSSRRKNEIGMTGISCCCDVQL